MGLKGISGSYCHLFLKTRGISRAIPLCFSDAPVFIHGGISGMSKVVR